MASQRHGGFLQGDLAEELGVFLLRSLAFVAPVPRMEDHGLDAIATLFRRDGAMLVAEDSFYVQMKAASKRTIKYVGQQATWLRAGAGLNVQSVRRFRGSERASSRSSGCPQTAGAVVPTRRYPRCTLTENFCCPRAPRPRLGPFSSCRTRVLPRAS